MKHCQSTIVRAREIKYHMLRKQAVAKRVTARRHNAQARIHDLMQPTAFSLPPIVDVSL